MHWLKSGLHTLVNSYTTKHKLSDENEKEKEKKTNKIWII